MPVTDTPHTMLSADIKRQRDDIHTLDLAGCNIAYVHKRLNEYELQHKGLNHRFESWPDTVRKDFEREVATWTERNPNVQLMGVTTGVHDGACNLALHWRPKPGGAA